MSGVRTIVKGNSIGLVNDLMGDATYLTSVAKTQPVSSIGFTYHTLDAPTHPGRLEALRLNGEALDCHGTRCVGGEILYLDEDEYINYVGLEFWNNPPTDRYASVQQMKVKTNKDRVLQTNGFSEDAVYEEYNNIRLIGLQAHYLPSQGRGFITQIVLHLVDDYQESVLGESEEAFAVISTTSQFTSFETVASSQVSKLHAASSMMEQIFSKNLVASVSTSATLGIAAVSGTFSASLSSEFGLEQQSRSSVQQEVEQMISTTETFTQEVGEGYIGIELVKVKVYNEANGFTWMYPVSAPQRLTIPIHSSLPNGVYDFTGVLGLQMPEMMSRKGEKHGYTWYGL